MAVETPQPPAGMQGSPGPLLRLIRNQKVAFLLVGGTNTVVGFLFFVFFEYTIGQIWGYLATLAFAHVFSVLCAFVLYRTFVFKVRGHVFRDLGRFELVYLVSLGINAALLPLLVELGGLAVIPAQALIVVVTTLVSYFGHRGFSFHRPGSLTGERPSESPAASGDAGAAKPLVSIVIPAYNNAEYLADTIDSVLAQTYPNLEVIIADHASSDGTLAVMRRYEDDERVTLLETPAGGGALRNWNRVSRAANGEYLKLVCGDDLLDPEIVTAQVAALAGTPGAVLAASARDIVDANGQPVMTGRGLPGLLGRHRGVDAIRSTVRHGTNVFGEPGCVLMRRDQLEAVGWWDSRWPYLIDEATYAKVLLRGDFVGVPGSLAGFRISDSQWSVRLAKQQAEQAIGFHRWLHEQHPDVVGRVTLTVGNARARLMATLRRFAYVYLARRMSRAGESTPRGAS
ncbi:glycosyltransferase [Agromyces sp. NPDC049794]|uniref:glycosyltransferase n=1 Tax=unclassified Agromyces TaxID=2639701 RepID=UPI0034065CFB